MYEFKLCHWPTQLYFDSSIEYIIEGLEPGEWENLPGHPDNVTKKILFKMNKLSQKSSQCGRQQG